MRFATGRIVTAVAAFAATTATVVESAGATVAPATRTASFPTSYTLTIPFLQDPGQPPDPAVYYAGEGLVLEDNTYDGLVNYAADTAERKIVPDLATSWTVSKDLTSYTFALRHGVYFHDGTPFTSAAVGPSFARDAAVGGGPAYMAEVVASVSTPNAYTAVVHLKAPNAAFLDYLACAYGPRIYSQTGLAKYAGTNHDQTYLQTHDLGTGPYVLTEAKVGVSYQLKAFPRYWGPKPYYTTVNFPVIDNFNTEEDEFNSGDLAVMLHDVTTQAIKSYEKDPSVSVYSLPTLQSETLLVNPRLGFLKSATDRLDIFRAINLNELVTEVYPGLGSVPQQVYSRNLVPDSMARQNDTYDPSVLSRLVSTLPASEKSLTIGYDTSSPSDQLIASIVTDDLDATGLQAKSVGYPTGELYSWPPPGNVPADAPALLIEYFWPDAFDAYQWSHIFWGSQGGVNIYHCVVPNLDAQVAQAVRDNDVALFGKVGDEAASSGCWFNVAERNDVFVAQKWLKGLPEGHIVADPYTVNLDGLYPG